GHDAVFLPNTSTGHNVVAGNFLGTDITGTKVVANYYDVDSYSPDNRIGGLVPADRNLIDGAGYAGLDIGGTGALIEGNFVGLDVTGTKAVPNYTGMELGGAEDAVVGGSRAAARNVVSGNMLSGVWLNNLTSANDRVVGNFIGTDVTGTKPLGNRDFGVTI